MSTWFHVWNCLCIDLQYCWRLHSFQFPGPRPTGDLRSDAAPSTPRPDRGPARIRYWTGSHGRGRRVISNLTPRPPRRAFIGVPHVPGVGRGEHGVPGTRAADPPTPGCGTLPTDCDGRSRHAQYPLESTVAARTASRDRHAQSPLSTSAVALLPSPRLHQHSFSFMTHFSIPSSIVFLYPFSIPVRCCAPRSPLSPIFSFFGRALEERGPLPRQRVRARPRPTASTVNQLSVKPRAASFVLGHPLAFWSGRHAGWAVFTVFFNSSPRQWVLVGP